MAERRARPRPERARRPRGDDAAAATTAPPRSAAIETAVYGLLVAGAVLAFDPRLQIQFALPKLLVLRTMTPVLIALWIQRLRTQQTQALPRPVVILTVALAAWWVITTMMSVHTPTALHGAAGRFNGLWTQLTCLTLFVLTASSALSLDTIERRLQLLVGALLIAAIYALVQRAGWDVFRWPFERPPSTLGNPVLLATALGLGIPIALASALREGRASARWLAGFATALLIVAVAATESRGPLVAIAAGVALVFAAAVDTGRLRRAHAVIVITILLVGGVAAAAYVVRARSGRLLPRAADLAREPEVQVRLHTLDAGLRMVRDRPIVGAGLETFGALYPRYRPAAADRLIPDVVATMAHSGYLQIATSTGVTGLVIYLVALAAILRSIKDAYRIASANSGLLIAACTASALVYLVADLTGWPDVALSTLFWLMLGLAVAAAGRVAPAGARPIRPGAVLFAAAGLGIIVSAVVALDAVGQVRGDRRFAEARRAAAANWPQAQTLIEEGLRLTSGLASYKDAAGYLYAERFGATGDFALYERAARLFDQAHETDPFGEYYLIHRIDLETTALLKQRGGRASTGANAAVAAALATETHNGAVYAACARLRLSEGAADQAVALIRRARELRPRRADYATLEGDSWRATGDRPRAAAAYRESLALAGAASPDSLGLTRKLIVTLLEEGDRASAAKEARELLARDPNDALARQLLALAEQ